jgi:hypothetical protein
VLTAVRRELAAAGQLETSTGAAALALAERIDQSTVGLPALVKELRQTMSVVRESTPRAGRLAELRASRR